MTRSYVTATLPALLVLGFFVWFANWIPQMQWTPPERREIRAEMSPGELAEMGRKIVRERGCLACHTLEPGVGVKGQGRGPNLDQIATRRAQGVPGGPDTLAEYLAQALYEPGAHLVEGYADIMPAATAAPAKLTYEEVVAVVAYLQSLGGEPSVSVGEVPRPAGEAARAVASAEAQQPAQAPPTDPAEILAAFQCLGCHSLNRGETQVGPPLDAATLREAAAENGMSVEAYLVESIVSPRAVERAGFPPGVMPADYGERLTAGQLEAVLTYLLSRESET